MPYVLLRKKIKANPHDEDAYVEKLHTPTENEVLTTNINAAHVFPSRQSAEYAAQHMAYARAVKAVPSINPLTAVKVVEGRIVQRLDEEY